MTNKILRKSYWTLLVFWAIAVTALICVSFQSIKRKPRMIADSIGNYFNEKGLIDHLKPPELRNNIWPSPRHSRNHIIEDRNITQSRIEYNKRLGAIVEGSAGHGVDPKVIERIKAQYGYPHDEKGKFLPPFLIAQMNSVTVTKNERKERDSANQNDPFTFKNVAVPKNQSQQKQCQQLAIVKPNLIFIHFAHVSFYSISCCVSISLAEPAPSDCSSSSSIISFSSIVDFSHHVDAG